MKEQRHPALLAHIDEFLEHTSPQTIRLNLFTHGMEKVHAAVKAIEEGSDDVATLRLLLREGRKTLEYIGSSGDDREVLICAKSHAQLATELLELLAAEYGPTTEF